MRSYTERRVGLLHRLTEVWHLYRMQSHDIANQVQELIEGIKATQTSIEAKLGEPLEGKSILEIGPGQKLRTATCFAKHNDVTAIDLDFVVRGVHPGQYWRMLRNNGPVRTAKTLARKMLGQDAKFEREVLRVLEIERPPEVRLLRMNAGEMSFADESFDCVVSFSVFEHLDEPAAVMKEIKRVLRPGAVACIYVHLFTSESGAHDVRVLSGQRSDIPLWAHLRPDHSHLVRPNSYLNEIRLPEWKELFAAEWPGVDFALFAEEGLTDELRALKAAGELTEFGDDELLTNVLAVLWKKP